MSVNYKDIIQTTIDNHYNIQDRYKPYTVEYNKYVCKSHSLGFSIAMVNVAGDLNIGINIRTASLMGADAVFIFGRRKYDRRSTVGAENYIDVHKHDVDDFFSVVNSTKYTPVFVEQGGKNLSRWVEHNDHPRLHPMFVFGSESEGIPEWMSASGPVVSIPQLGVLRSYNVSTACSIVCWEYVRKNYPFSMDG